MDKEAIKNLENYLFEHIQKPNRAASVMANIIGVAIDVKPTSSLFFYFGEMKKIDPFDFLNLLEPLGLKALFYHREMATMGRVEWIEDVTVSKDIKLAAELTHKGDELGEIMDDNGTIIDQTKWEELSREIGKLYGYPSTATEYFIEVTDIEDPERQKVADRNRYYIHSPEHEEEEFKSYDLKINQAVEEYAPHTAEILKQEEGIRWLS